VQVVRLLRGPALKGRRVARYRREVAVVQPVEHGLLLLDARPLDAPRLGAVLQVHRAQRGRGPLLGGQLVIPLDPARADQQDVADLDVAALRLRADVDPLRLAAFPQLLEGDGVAEVRVVGDAVGFGVSPVVEEDAAAGDAVVGPVVDAAFEVGVGARDVTSLCLDNRSVSEQDLE